MRMNAVPNRSSRVDTRTRRASSLVFLLAVLPAATGCRTLAPDAERSEVLGTVQAFFDAMTTRDAVAAERTVIPDGTFVNLRFENGTRRVKHFTNREWLDGLSKPGPHLGERFVEPPTVLVDGDVATVWGRYEFTLDGRVSHTGVDALTLLRTPDGWRIAGGAYTVLRADDPPAQ